MKQIHCLAIGLLFMLGIGLIIGCDDYHEVVTEDGVTLKMKRYRPAVDAPFRENQQPILLLPGNMSNMNEFLVHTSEEKKKDYAAMELPADAAEWAIGEPYIEEDPMKYYSLAHYLWVKGYDVWLGNYRGTGRKEYKSENGSNITNIDIWACFDTPAFIEKVKEETGLKPVIGGHSTGSIVSEIYLQGAYIDIDEFNAADGKYIPHVKNDPALAAIRNSEIKGFIGIDPAGLTPIATPLLLDNPLTWAVQGLPLRIPFDEIMVTLLGDHRLGAIPVLAIEVVMGAAKALAPVDITGIVDMLYISNPQNINNYVEDFFARYALSSFYMRGASQFVDMALHLTLREHYKNGEENKNRNVPPDPGTAGDDLYSYSENMYLMSVPSFFLLSELDGLVKTELVIESVIEAKEYNVNDEWYEMPGTGHMDVTASLNAPTFFYPKLGAWLEKIK
ncbi:MAG: hypothetical protein R6U29_01435 [Desulfosudaceae bacterium]